MMAIDWRQVLRGVGYALPLLLVLVVLVLLAGCAPAVSACGSYTTAGFVPVSVCGGVR